MYLTLATCFWGGNYIVGRLLVSNILPVTLSWFRWLPAMLIVTLLYRKQIQQQWHIIRENLGNISLLAMLGVVIFPTTLYQGLQTTNSLNASLYLATVPSLVILLNRLFFKMPVTNYALVGSTLSLLGVLILISKGKLSVLLQLNINTGDIWAMLSAISWACYCSLIKIKPSSLTTGAFLGVSLGMGVLLLMPIWLAEMYHYQLTAEYLVNAIKDNFVALLYLVLAPSVASYWLWNKGLEIVGTEKGALFNHLIPLSSAVLAILFMKEAIFSYHIVSALAIVLGIWVSQR